MELDIISRYFETIELHARDTYRTIPETFGARIKAGGGRYSEMRSCHQSTRYVTIDLRGPDALRLIEQILASCPTPTMILRSAVVVSAGHGRVYAMTYAPPAGDCNPKRQHYRKCNRKLDAIVLSTPGGRSAFSDLQGVAMYVAEMERECASARMHNAITHGILGTELACGQFAASLCEHLRLCAATRTALSVALDRIELRVLKGEPIV